MHHFLFGICAKQAVFLVFKFDVKHQLQRLKGKLDMTAPDVVTEMFAAYRTSLDSLEGKLGSAFSDRRPSEGMSGKVVVCGMGKSGLVGTRLPPR